MQFSLRALERPSPTAPGNDPRALSFGPAEAGDDEELKDGSYATNDRTYVQQLEVLKRLESLCSPVSMFYSE